MSDKWIEYKSISIDDSIKTQQIDIIAQKLADSGYEVEENYSRNHRRNITAAHGAIIAIIVGENLEGLNGAAHYKSHQLRVRKDIATKHPEIFKNLEEVVKPQPKMNFVHLCERIKNFESVRKEEISR